jgi:hypothetical protein
MRMTRMTSTSNRIVPIIITLTITTVFANVNRTVLNRVTVTPAATKRVAAVLVNSEITGRPGGAGLSSE